MPPLPRCPPLALLALVALCTPLALGCDTTIAAIARLDGASHIGFAAFGVSQDCSANVTVYLQGAADLCSRTDPCEINIHTQPVVNGDCASAGDIWDPTGMLPTDNCTSSAPQQCAAGQLSLKHGTLTLDPHRLSFTDAYVGLEGAASVVGRSVVVQRASDGHRVMCATLVRNSTVGTVRLAATVGEVSVSLVQQSGSPLTNAHITATATAVLSSSAWSIAPCSDTTAPFNPTPPTNASLCSATNQAQCAMGDMTGKHGQLAVGAGQGVVFGDTNVNAQATGDGSVVGKCLVVGEASTAIAAVEEDCSGTAISGTATFTGDVTGTITFSQPPNLACGTTVTVDLHGLEGNNAYHVHQFPNDDAALTGGHFDPFGVEVDGYACSVDNLLSCYVGDLSGKHGKLTQGSVSYTGTDGMLPLSGPHSILFHPIVIHRADGSRWTTAQVLPTGSGVKRLMVMYGPDWASPEVLGNVTFYQSADDSTAITAIHVKAKYNQGGSGYSGMWHVHETSGDADNKCINIGGHFNPYGAMMGCSPLLPEFCEVGDFSGKHGMLYLPSPNSEGYGEYLYMDPQLPLTGDLSIQGKAAVIHYYNGDTLACGDLFDPDQGYPTPYPSPESPTPHPSPGSDGDDGLSGGEVAAIVLLVGFVVAVAAALVFRKFSGERRSNVYTGGQQL